MTEADENLMLYIGLKKLHEGLDRISANIDEVSVMLQEQHRTLDRVDQTLDRLTNRRFCLIRLEWVKLPARPTPSRKVRK